jgi:PAS domain S-box-containing protein
MEFGADYDNPQQRDAAVSALLDAAHSILKYQKFEDAARAIFDSCKELIGATAGYVALLSADGSENEVLFLDSGGLPCTVDPSLPMPIRGLRAESYRHGKAVYDNDFPNSEWMRFMPQGHVCLDNVIFAPLMLDGKAVGLLGLANKHGGFTDRDAYLASAFGDFAAIAFSNSRTFDERLQKSEERYKHIIESVTDYIYTVKIENGVAVSTTHGPACLTVTGYSAEEYDADPFLWIHMVHEDDRDAVIEQANGILRGERPIPLEHRIIQKGGSIRWVRNTAVPRYEGGRLIAYDGLVSDITERKEAEEALIRSKEFSETVINSVDDAICIIDVGGFRITGANKAFLKAYGLRLEEAIGRQCCEITHRRKTPCIPPEHPCPLIDAVKNGAHSVYEHIHFDKEGNKIYVEVSATPIRNEKGEITHVVHVCRDITGRKSLEEQIRQSQKMEAVGLLAGGVAHDFNNMLTAIIGYSNLVQMKLQKDDLLKPYVDQILSAGEKAANLTQSLLAFSRKQILDKKAVSLNEIVRRMEKLLLRLIGEDIELKTAVAEKDLTVTADAGQIEQVVMNLCTNARDAMPDGGILTIETGYAYITDEYAKIHLDAKPGRYALISISDTGVGMDEKTRERIFDPFFTTKEMGKGTGLGLSIVYGIVKQHNGFVNVYSEPAKGATFRIYLPLTAHGIEREETAALPPLEGGIETILVAEDSEDVRGLIKTALEDKGYEVIEACDGEEAIRLFNENQDKIKLTLLDVIMPKKNGKEAYEEIKRLMPDIKAVFMSGYTADIVSRKGIIEKGLEFISKPVSPEELLRKVRKILDQ